MQRLAAISGFVGIELRHAVGHNMVAAVAHVISGKAFQILVAAKHGARLNGGGVMRRLLSGIQAVKPGVNRFIKTGLEISAVLCYDREEIKIPGGKKHVNQF